MPDIDASTGLNPAFCTVSVKLTFSISTQSSPKVLAAISASFGSIIDKKSLVRSEANITLAASSPILAMRDIGDCVNTRLKHLLSRESA